MPPTPSPANLRSPGHAIARRSDLERTVLADSRAQYRRFMVEVEKQANLAYGTQHGLTAAGLLLHSFTLGGVLGAWADVVRSIMRSIANAFGTTLPDDALTLLPVTASEAYLHSMSTRLLQYGLPSDVFATVQDTIASAAASQMSKDALARLLSEQLEASASQWLIDRIATTEATGASNFATVDALDTPNMMWVAVGDAATRPTHQEADGQVVPSSGLFLVGGEALAFPGDPGGSPEETYNCRCVVVGTDSAPT